MRKSIISSIVLCFSSVLMVAQNPNPQQNFASQEYLANPSLLLNFNDATTSFRESISGTTFGGVATSLASLSIGSSCTNVPVNSATSTSCTLTAQSGNTIVVFVGNGTPSSVTDSLGATAVEVTSQGSVSVWTFVNVSTGSHVITASYSTAIPYPVLQSSDVSGAATVSPVDGYSTNVVSTSSTTFTSGGVTTAGVQDLLVGFIFGSTNAYTLTPPVFTEISGGLWTGIFQAHYLATTMGSYAFTGSQSDTGGYTSALVAIKPKLTTYTSGTVSVRQPGFDSAHPDNTSAAFPYNGFNIAPSTSLGSIDWNVPWTMLVHVDRLNWNRTGVLVLASKGDTSSVTNNWWQLSLMMVGNDSQLCFTRNGANSVGSSFGNSQSTVCTNAGYEAMPNGFSYDITLVDTGTGHPSSLDLFINGLDGSSGIPESTGSGSYQFGFGAVSLTVAGGAGYANSSAFSSVGGGPNCTVNGTLPATGGVPTSGLLSLSYFNLYDAGCTSLPTIVLTNATGVGVTLTAILAGASFNSMTYPLMVPGYASGGAYYGIAGTNSTQTSTYVDEFAIFPDVLNQTQIQGLFSQTKFWQGVLAPKPTSPAALVVDEDGCADTDNLYAIALAIAAHKVGYVRLVGLVDTVGDGPSEAMFRQMLDQAGLANVPVAVSSSFALSGSGTCTVGNLNSYNASTPKVTNMYPQAAGMYRQIMAANPTTPVNIMLGGSFRGVADLMGSAADNISSLTGAQLIAQDAANGGAIYAQGLGCCGTVSGDNSLQDWTAGQYVVSHNGAMPIYWYGGTPQNTGPGILASRTGKDPMYLMAAALGTDTRNGWDSMPVAALLSPLFSGGVTVSISGSGTGYAVSTAFTSTGGGANCTATGFLVSTGGVPSSILSSTGVTSAGISNTGLGSGCFTAASPPTIVLTNPTGVGAVLTAATTASACGTYTITGQAAGSSSMATCSNHYFLPNALSTAQTPVQGPMMEWLINSLIDLAPGVTPRRQ
jgi:hypothetical protein